MTVRELNPRSISRADIVAVLRRLFFCVYLTRCIGLAYKAANIPALGFITLTLASLSRSGLRALYR